MLSKISVGIFLIFITLNISFSAPNIIDYDLSEFYSSGKPLINFESFFGDIISANTLFQKVDKQQFYSVEYKYDSKKRVIEKNLKDIYSDILITKYYDYNEKNQIIKIVIVCDSYKKSFEFTYQSNRIKTIIEKIYYQNSIQNNLKYDYLLYEFDKHGRIGIIYGYNESFFGLIKKSKILRTYDYYENGHIKFIWNFENPNNTQRFDNSNIVRNN